MDLFTLIPISIIEASVILLLIHALSGNQLSAKKIALAAPFQGIFAVSMRLIFANYILNIILCSVSLIVILSIYKVKTITERIVLAFISVSVYIVLEFLNIKVYETIINLTPKEFLTSPLSFVVGFTFHILAVLAVILIIFRYKLTLFGEQI